MKTYHLLLVVSCFAPILLIAGCEHSKDPAPDAKSTTPLIQPTQGDSPDEPVEVESEDVVDLSDAECEQFANDLIHALETDDLLGAIEAVNWQEILERATGGTEAARSEYPVAVGVFESQLPISFIIWERVIDKVANGGSLRLVHVGKYQNEKSILLRVINNDGSLEHLELLLARQSGGKIQATDIYMTRSNSIATQLREAFKAAVMLREKGGANRLDAGVRRKLVNLPKVAEMSTRFHNKQYATILSMYHLLPASIREMRGVMLLRILAASKINHEELTTSVMEFRERFPNDPAGDFAANGRIMLDAGEYEEFFDNIDAFERLLGGDPYLDFCRAQGYRHKGDIARAKELLRKVIEYDPGLVMPWIRLHEISLEENDHETTAMLLKTLVEEFNHITEDELLNEEKYADFVASDRFAAFQQWLQDRPEPQPAPQPRARVASLETLESTVKKLVESNPKTAQALNRWYSVERGATDITPLWLRALRPFDERSFRITNQRLDSLELQSLLRSGSERNIPNPGISWRGWDLVSQLLSTYDQPLQRLHETALLGGQTRYPLRFELGPLDSMPHCEQIQNAAKILSLQALHRAHLGDHSGAAQSLQTILRMNRTLQNEPVEETLHVRASVCEMATTQFENLLGKVEFSDEDLKVLLEEFLADNYQDGLYSAVLGARVIGRWVFDDPQARIAGVAKIYVQHESYKPETDLANFYDYMQKVVDTTRESPPDTLMTFREIMDSLNEEADSHVLDVVLSVSTCPPLVKLGKASTRAGTLCQFAAGAIAVELYRRDQGELPKNLFVLMPKYLRRPPKDRFTDDFATYLQTDGGFSISNYSGAEDRELEDASNELRQNVRLTFRYLSNDSDDEASQPPAAEENRERIWTSRDGEFSVKAILLSQSEKSVVLKRKDGREVTVSKAILSDADRQYLLSKLNK